MLYCWSPAMERPIETAFGGRRSASASNVVQICRQHVAKVIIPFIPLTADLKNGHEESVN
jgi:hypothetical protein